jgi:hypothetical protein
MTGRIGTLAVSVQAKVARAPVPFTLPLVAALHAQSVSTTGSLSLAGGGSVSLSGTYDAGAKSLTLSGGGYSVSGTLGGTAVTGTLTAPTGTAGAFRTASTSDGPTTLYCSEQVTPSGERVVWNVVVADLRSGQDANGDGIGDAGVIQDISGSFAVTPSGAGYVTGYLQGTGFTTTYYTTVGPFKGDFGTSSGTMRDGVANGIDKGGNPFTASTGSCGTLNGHLR